MLRVTLAFSLAMVLSSAAGGQTSDHPTEFEVASVKPAEQQPMNRISIMMRGGPGSPDPGQITYTNVSLRNILTNAYGVKGYQISGPGFLDTERFDLVAKVPKGATKDDAKIMLQKLLAERFQLKVHREQKEASIYALVVGKNGPKLKESAEDPPSNPDVPPLGLPPGEPRANAVQGGRMPTDKDGFPKLPPGAGRRGMMMMFSGGHLRLQGNQQPVASMVDMLSNQLGRPVVDQTGLTGKYDYTLDFTPEEGQMMKGPMGAMPPPPPPPPGAGPASADSAPDSAPAPNLFTAVQEQLGLKLEPKKGPVEQIVIDHIEKAPTEN